MSRDIKKAPWRASRCDVTRKRTPSVPRRLIGPESERSLIGPAMEGERSLEGPVDAAGRSFNGAATTGKRGLLPDDRTESGSSVALLRGGAGLVAEKGELNGGGVARRTSLFFSA